MLDCGEISEEMIVIIKWKHARGRILLTIFWVGCGGDQPAVASDPGTHSPSGTREKHRRASGTGASESKVRDGKATVLRDDVTKGADLEGGVRRVPRGQ